VREVHTTGEKGYAVMGEFAPGEERDALWASLCQKRVNRLWKRACSEYLEGFGRLAITMDAAPSVEEVNKRLELFGWSLEPVEELIPVAVFFEMLSKGKFPANPNLRYRPEGSLRELPDLFHDVMGHAPMLADSLMGDFVRKCGVAAEGREGDALERIIRFFWYTVELGLVREGPTPKIYGATLASSGALAQYVFEHATQVPFSLDEVLATPVTIDTPPEKVFVLDDLEELFELLEQV
jgi:phenylalanine-4-hydroxylase